MKRTSKRILTIVLTVCLLATTFLTAIPAAAASVPTLTVDMDAEYRELYHGASGWLYGLGDEGIPSTNTITPLKAHTTVQKAPLGMQHPEGDTLDIAKTFKDSGGKYIQIYMPDYFALWFYEVADPEYFRQVCLMQAQACIDAGIADIVTYVPFNEPNENWISGYNGKTGWNGLFELWKQIVIDIRNLYDENNLDYEPLFVGLNLAGYSNSVMTNFMTYCANNDCVPDIISWHDLSTGQFNNFNNEYTHYRNLEKSLGLEEKEIVINEYAAQYECASPGNLIRWIGLFEDYEVAGCLPFWHFSNNLNGLAANSNEGTGAWWMYKWYGDMSGSYKPITVSNAAKADFYGLSSLDDNKKNATVIFGGVDGSSEIVLDGITNTETFADDEIVHVKVEATDFTSFHGAADEPYVVYEGAVKVKDGKATIPVDNMKYTTGYKATVTKAADNEVEGLINGPFKAVYEAEDGTLFGGSYISGFDSRFAGSGGRKVCGTDGTDDGFSSNVTVPYSGYYKLELLYATANGYNKENLANHNPINTKCHVQVNGGEAIVAPLTNTAGWHVCDIWSDYVYLNAGENTIKVSGSGVAGEWVDFDCFYLTYKGATEDDTKFSSRYEAELSEFNQYNGTTTTLSTESDGKDSYITGLEGNKVTEGGGARFLVNVPKAGLYLSTWNYKADADATANIYVDNDAVSLDNLRTQIDLKAADKWTKAYSTLFLQQGLNIIDIDTEGAIELNYMQLDEASNDEPMTEVEAESGILTLLDSAQGKASVVSSDWASGNSYVSAIPAANDVALVDRDDAENNPYGIYGVGTVVDKGEPVDGNNLSISVNVPSAGTYKMVVHESYDELFGNHSYNWQIVQRYATFQVNGGEPQKVVLLNSFSNQSFYQQVVSVELEEGENTIKIYNDNSKVNTNGLHQGNGLPWSSEYINYGVIQNYTPNFDKFVFYPMTAESVVPDTELFKITANSTDGGMVTADKESVTAGETVKFTFRADSGYKLKMAMVDGADITSKLLPSGGVYTLSNVQNDITAVAYYEKTSTKPDVTDGVLVYNVNCGDIDPTTFGTEAQGTNHSVTDQFYGADPATGKMWGVVDTYRQSSSYPNLLTGIETWPAENVGASDSSSKETTYRYLRNINPPHPGINYKFEVEEGKRYSVEMGFNCGWGSGGTLREMKLEVNDILIDERFNAADNNANAIVKKNITVEAADGEISVLVGFAAGASWGPVINYITITELVSDKASLAEAIAEAEAMEESEYSSESWDALQDVLSIAKNVYENTDAKQSEIADAEYELRLQMSNMVNIADYAELEALYNANKDKEKGTYTDESWSVFQDALENARIALENTKALQEDIDTAKSQLEAAINGLVSIPVETYILGNAYDADTAINLKDVLTIQKHVASLVTLEGKALKAADVDRDGVVALRDALMLQKWIVRLIQDDDIGKELPM